MYDYAMMIPKRKNKQNLIGENSRGITIDTTNKGSRPRDPSRDNKKRGGNYRVFIVSVDLHDTTNKEFRLHLALVDTTNKKM